MLKLKYLVCSDHYTATGAMSSFVKGFGCRPLEGPVRECGGRRPKASKGGNRAWGNVRPCGRRYGDLSAAGELVDWVGADAASCATMAGLVNEQRVASNSINCRPVCDDRWIAERNPPWLVDDQRARRADLRDGRVIMMCRS